MEITGFLIQRKCRYDGQYAPELVVTADEVTMDENPEWFQEEVAKALAALDSLPSASAVIKFSIPDAAIQAALYPHPKPIQVENVKSLPPVHKE